MEATLTAETRTSRGKNEARRLRVAGKIPGIVYGGAGEATAVAVDPKILSRILHSDSGMNTLIALSHDGQTTRVIVKDYLLDPVKHHMLHVDFYRIAMDKPITVSVPIEIQGESRGVKQQGGIIDLPHRQVDIESLPGEIPESLVIDVSELMIGQAIRLKDLAATARWKPVSDPDTMLVHIVAARLEATATDEGAAPAVAPAEPEVIKKGKTDKDEA